MLPFAAKGGAAGCWFWPTYILRTLAELSKLSSWSLEPGSARQDRPGSPLSSLFGEKSSLRQQRAGSADHRSASQRGKPSRPLLARSFFRQNKEDTGQKPRPWLAPSTKYQPSPSLGLNSTHPQMCPRLRSGTGPRLVPVLAQNQEDNWQSPRARSVGPFRDSKGRANFPTLLSRKPAPLAVSEGSGAISSERSSR